MRMRIRIYCKGNNGVGLWYGCRAQRTNFVAGPVWSGGNSVFIASWLFGSPYPVHRWPRKISTHKQHGGSINFPCVAVKVTYKHYSGLFLIRIHFLNSDFDPSRNVQLPPIAHCSQFGTLLPL